MSDNVKWFKELSKDSIEVGGGKAANLAEMSNIGLPVPPGFVVTAQAYQKFIETTGIASDIYTILGSLNVDDSDALQKASKKIASIISSHEIPREMKEEILEAYDSIDDSENVDEILESKKHAFVAVRSSATAEDLPSISEEEFVLVKINEKPFFGRMKELSELIKLSDKLQVQAMQDFKVVWRNVSELYRHKVDGKKLHTITTATGKKITISPNHTLIILDEDTMEPRTAEISSLKGNERVPVVKIMPKFDEKNFIEALDYVNGDDVEEFNGKLFIKNNSSNWKIQQDLPKKIKLTKEMAYLFGIYAAEGSTYKNNCITITNSSPEIIEKARSAFRQLGLKTDNKINKHSLRVYCKSLVRLLHNACGMPSDIKGKGKLCGSKKVPDFIYSASHELIGEFLKGCFDGDGTVGGNISYTSKSEALIAGMCNLLSILGIEYYIRPKGDYFNLLLPLKETSSFKEKISFTHHQKLERIEELLAEYQRKESHHDFLNNISISKKVSAKFREAINSSLPKEKVIVNCCPDCGSKVNKSSSYQGRERNYCKFCKKAIYEENTVFVEIESYIDRNDKGRFLEGIKPWNKSINSAQNYGLQLFKEKINEAGLVEISAVFDESIIWDKIIKIEGKNYDSWVYDFTVPEVENFASGLGNVITHNSASFAGQQATYLNIKGHRQLLEAVRDCWASLFTARAIYYRVKNKFEHQKVFIAVVVQKMVNSEKSGIMFSINPSTNNDKEIVIEAVYGLGEAIVSGSVNPNTYIVDKSSFQIKDKKMRKQSFKLVKDKDGKNVQLDVSDEENNRQTINDKQILELASLSKKIEDHYGKPQDMEWAIEGDEVMIVQSRAVTTFKKQAQGKQENPEAEEKISAKILVEGQPASPGIASGKVKIIKDASELSKINKGDVLVTKMTNPDMVPAMERAVAIVTDSGGATCHASIVSREMGIPCIVGTEKATTILKENSEVTVDAFHGKVYEGKIEIKHEIKEEKMDVSTVTKVKVNCDLPNFAERAAKTGADGIGLLRLEFLIANSGKHPAKYIRENKDEEYIGMLMDGISKIASHFEGKQIWVRTSDIRTDEYRNLEGGEEEPHEINPMIGWHAIRRGIDEPRIIKAEFTAIKRLHEKGLKNIGVMIPFVIKLEELQKAKQMMREVGMEPCKDLEFGVMIETPAACWIIEDLCKEGISFISFGTNDLTQCTLGVDRDNDKIAHLFDEMHPAVLGEIAMVLKTCKKYKVQTSICGQAGSRPEMAEFLVKHGITSVSANVDAVNKIRNVVAKIEHDVLEETLHKEE